MSADKVQLDVLVNTQPVVHAVGDLGSLEQAVGKLTSAIEGMNKTAEKAAPPMQKVETAAQRMEKRVAAAQKEIREMSSAVGVLNGPLGGISGRLSSLASLFDRVTPQMALFTAGMIAITGVGVFLTGSVMKAAEAYDILQARIKNATASTGDYKGVSQELNNITRETGVSLDNNVAAFGRFKIAASTLGKSNADILGVQKTVDQIGVMSNLSDAKLREVMSALSRGFATGALRGREFTSVLRNMPGLAQAMANAMGTTVLKLIEQAKAGKVSAVQGFEAIQKAADGVDAKFKNFPITIARAKVSMDASFAELADAINKTFNLTGNTAKFFMLMADGFKLLKDNLDAVLVSFTTFVLLMAALNYDSIVTALGYVGGAFKAFAELWQLEGIQLAITNAATSFSFAEMATNVRVSVMSMVGTVASFNTAAQVTMVDNIGLSILAATNTAKAGVASFTASLWACVTSEVAASEGAAAIATTLFGPAIKAIVGTTEAVIGLTGALLLNPWTYVVAGIVATALALYNLKQSVQENTKLHVTWGNVATGIWKTLADDTTRRVTNLKNSITSWWDTIKQGQGILSGLANWSSTTFSGIVTQVKKSTNELAAFLDKIQAIHAVTLQMKLLQSEAKANIGNAASQDSQRAFMQKIGYTGKFPTLGDDEANAAFDADPRVKAARALMKKNHWSYQQYVDGYDTPSTKHGAPGIPTVKPKKDAMANRIANFTFNTDLENKQSASLLDYHQDHTNLQYERELLRQEAIKKVDEKHFKFKGTAAEQKAQRDSLVGKVYQTSINKADDKAVGAGNDIEAHTKAVQKLDAAVGTSYDNIARVNRENAIAAQMDKVLASGKERADIRTKMEAEYDAKLALQKKENNDLDQIAFDQQKAMTDAQGQGIIAIQNLTLAQDAHNRAVAKYKDDGVEAVAKAEAQYLAESKLKAQGNLNAQSNQMKITLDQTKVLTDAVKQGAEAYRVASIEVAAYNQAQADGNALTQDAKDAVKEQILQQEAANRALEIATYKTQESDQAAQAMGQAFANSFDSAITGATTLSGALKQLGLDILKIAEQEAVLKPIQNFLGGNSQLGQTGLFQKIFSAIGGAASSGAGASAAGAVGGFGEVLSSATMLAAAHGHVFGPGGLSAFAKGGVVSSPHIFPFANGTGLMGEAGPEAIVPLRRMPNGDLGIQNGGGGNSSGGVTVNQQINITMSGSGEKSDHDALMKTLPTAIKAMVVDGIMQEQRPGGLLNKGNAY